MGDTLYGTGTLIFFALMLAYGYACERLGNDDNIEQADL